MANAAAGPATAASCKFRSLSWQVIAPAIYFSMLVCAAPCSVANETPETKIELDLAALLANTLREQGPSYRPRTEHLNVDGSPQYTNRLLLETSPYLIQHAHNLVNWFPWGTAAFAKARREDKLIFLSIGYSTCHWCHVMKKRVSITSRLRNFSTTILLR